jgi:hypothetical protein
MRSNNLNYQSFSANTLNGIAYVLPALTRGGIDIGDELNKAYASLPSNGGLIYLVGKSDGSCYNFSTPIVFATAGKLPNVVALGTAGGGVTQAGQGSVCLNYLPTTGTAITLDYVGNFSANTMNAHGFSNIFLMNNGCTTSGGCTSSAVGIDNGNTNAGMAGATLQNITITGFGVGWRNVSHVSGGESQSVEMLWLNPLFFKNTTAIVIENPTGIVFMKGAFFSNGKAIVGNDSNAGPEIKMFGTTFAGNTTSPIVDFTATTATPANLYTFGVHWETTTPDMNFIAGYINLSSNGDFFETNSTAGSGCTDLIDAKLFSNIKMVSASINAAGPSGGCPVVVNAETTNVVGQIKGFVRGFTAIAGGVGATNIQSDVFNVSTVPQLQSNAFPGGVGIGGGFGGVRNPMTFRGPANGGLWTVYGDDSALHSAIGSIASTGGPSLSYNAVANGVSTYNATDGTKPTALATIDSANELSYWFSAVGNCPTTGANTFTTCFGASPITQITHSGLKLNGSANPILLNGSAGNSGQALVSGGAGTTPSWITLPNISGTPTTSKATCWKTATQIGFCSTQPDATGSCTCN